jgi:hypothetical protein
MLENTEGAIKNEQFRETGNIAYTRRRQTKEKDSTIYVGHHPSQANTNNINKGCSYKQLEVKTIRTSFYAEIVTDIPSQNSERKDTIC